MDYYKRYMGDYGRDTSRLSMIEHGAYGLLLDDYYSTRTPLPADLNELYRICRATTKPEQTAVESVAKRYFPVCDDGLRHSKRADEEIAKWEVMAEENREKGKLGGRPKKNPSGNPQGNPTGSSGGNPEETQRVSGGLAKGGVLETRKEPSPIPNPNPDTRSLNHSLSHTQSARVGEANSSDGGTEGNIPPDTTDAWRDAGCDAQAYEAWLAYRAAENDHVPDHVRLYHAKFLGGKGTPEVQRAFVADLIQRQFKRLHDPAADGRPATARAAPKKRWHPDDGDPTEPKAATP